MRALALLMAGLIVLFAAGCAGRPPAPADSLDAIAADYVRLSLEAGEREPGYVDAYYGPADWAEAAKAAPRDQPTLLRDARALSARLAALPAAGGTQATQRRRAFLAAQLKAAETRLAMATGQTFSFVDEAEGLFGVRPVIRPLAQYDAVLARIEAIVPGDGPLADRVNAFQTRLTVPADRLEPVMRAAIAECRARTARHIAMPDGEAFTLEFVTDKPWSGYNWYKGGYVSLIQVNTDQPVRISRAVDLGCHEGYPGHHLLNMLLESRLSRGRGWVEFTILPLFSPMGLIAEGTANYGVDLAFPGGEKLAFEQSVLYPLAGLDPALAVRQNALGEAMRELGGVQTTVAQLYLDGQIDRETAIGYLQRYQLVSRARAEQSIRFIETYRSYVINYSLGQDMARAYVEAAAPDAAGRWRVFADLIGEPTIPADLLRRPGR